MSTNHKLIRRLRREVTANPAKTVFLGLLLLVAIWFWAPLVGKWFGKSGAGDETTVATAGGDEPISPSSDKPVPATIAKANTPNWRQMLDWIGRDPLMEPRLPQDGQRDPFLPAPSRVEKQIAATQQVEKAPDVTPQQAGLQLHSTVVGSHVKTALINGRAYHEQQTIPATNSRERFLLVEIRPTGVVLEHHGRSYEIKLPRSDTTSNEN